MVERRTDEQFERRKQEAETLIAEIERLFPEVERVVGSARLRPRRASPRRAPWSNGRAPPSLRKDTAAVEEQVEQLGRTQRMFKGVVSRS